MKPELEKKLFEKYPLIFQGKDLPITQNLMAFGFECGDGWYFILDKLCESIQSHIDNPPYTKGEKIVIPQVIATQVKEKFGGLRFYYDGGDDEIDGMVSLAETVAWDTCEICGSHENMGTTSGWIKRICINCKKDESWKQDSI